MEYDLNQWRNQMYQLENQQPEKNPRLFPFQESDFGSSSSSNVETALPLFVAEPNSRISSLSTNSKFLGIGVGLFSWIQWQELELQALIFKYMLAGVAVPIELIQSIKKTSLTSPLCYLHYPPTPMFQSGYWGRGSIDPQPGRCRRTDGKKWRCSRDVVPDHKYCERHVNRGRNRSRKPVEIPTPASAGGAVSSLKMTNDSATLSTVVAGGTNFAHSISPYTKLLHLNQSRYVENKAGNRFLVETDSNNFGREQKPSGQILRHFFDDWSRSDQESHDPDHNSSSAVSASCLSISTLPRNNSSSDFSLKLSTGNGNERPEGNKRPGEQPQLNWEVGWGTYQVSPMGGPLAEALRPSTTNSSPTSVFHQLRRSSVSETSSISA